MAGCLPTVHSLLPHYEQKHYIVGGGTVLSFKTMLFQLFLHMLVANKVKAKVIV